MLTDDKKEKVLNKSNEAEVFLRSVLSPLNSAFSLHTINYLLAQVLEDVLEERHILCILETRTGDKVCPAHLLQRIKIFMIDIWLCLLWLQEAQHFVMAKRASAKNQTIHRNFKLSKDEQLIAGMYLMEAKPVGNC